MGLFRLVSAPRPVYARREVERALPLTAEMEASKGVMSYFDRDVMVVIVTNAVMLGAEHVGMDARVKSALDWTNYGMSVLFLLECATKQLALGPLAYFSDGFNGFDTAIVVLSLPELVLLPMVGDGQGLPNLTFLRLLRVGRLLRSFKVLVRSRHVKPLLVGLQAGMREMGSFLVLVWLFLFIFALAGRQLFGGKLPASYPKRNYAKFDTLDQALFTSLQVATGSGWTQAMYLYMGNGIEQGQAADAVIAVVYFIGLVIFGKFTLMQMLTALMISKIPGRNYLVQVTGCMSHAHASCRPRHMTMRTPRASRHTMSMPMRM